MNFYYQNLKYDFYCRDTRFSGNTLGIVPHLHFHVELAILFEGKTRISVDTDTFEVEAGDAFVIFPNQVHRYETLEREKYILLIVNPEIISEFSGIFTSSLPVSNKIPGAANDKELRELMFKISDAYRSDEAYRDVVLRGYLLAFFGKLFGKIDLKDFKSREIHVLGTIMNYCMNNFDRDLSLDTLEKELHLSKYYISHVISNKLNIGFNDYVNSLRVSNACKYLLKTDKSITEISEIVGFNTLRTFNRAFQKQMGITPSDYRLKHDRKKPPVASLPM
ncbi:MAG: helix-turn-helix domain-containing protein [Eubacteriales bacterium]